MGNDVISWRAAIGLFHIKTCRFLTKQTVHFGFDYALYHIMTFCMLLLFNLSLARKGLNCQSAQLYIVVVLLLLKAGDVESNPGPTEPNCGTSFLLICFIVISEA